MAGDWSEVVLGDLISVKHGWPFKSQLFSEQLTGRAVVINIGNFRYTGGFRFDSTTVREYRGEYPQEYDLRAGEILLVMTCQTAGGEILGVPARVPNDGKLYLHNQRLGRVVIKRPDEINDKFLYYLFLSPAFNRELYVSASGTKILHTAPSRIEAVRVSLPPPAIQERIGCFLGSLDDKIELNRRMSVTLEEMARAIFQCWFVNLDATQGTLPKGWREGSLLDHAGLNPESWTRTTFPNEIRYVDLANTKRGRIESTASHTRTDAPSRAQRVLRAGDSIVGTVRPGNQSFALVAAEGLTGSTGFAVLRPNAPHHRAFVYCCATSEANIERLAHLADGGAYPAVRPEVVAQTASVVPSDSVLCRFEKVVGPLLDRIALNDHEDATLASLRDNLLPKLVSGELRVKHAEREVEAVL
ncbi:MAG TPA: restriction endonuclease subunit S [Vicinamibacterales bacterium]|nr:restriction endonuclease subunit S [Vicinamibacterales bacterium]